MIVNINYKLSTLYTNQYLINYIYKDYKTRVRRRRLNNLIRTSFNYYHREKTMLYCKCHGRIWLECLGKEGILITRAALY